MNNNVMGYIYKSAYILSSNKEVKPTKCETDGTNALSQIFAYVEQFLIHNQRTDLLTSVYERYVDICSATSETPRSSAFSLSRALTNHCKSRI